MNIPILPAGILALLLLMPGHALSQRFDSGELRNTLIELYTSEGCSSCPPAEQHLNKYEHNEQLWKRLFPVAWHVDYWDYIGWKDRFARPEFGTRQRRYAELNRVRTVYTPAFIVNGQKWRAGWISNDLETGSRAAPRLVVELKDGQLQANYVLDESQRLELHVALLGMNLKSSITRGENRGRQSEHEFVVIGYGRNSSNTLSWQVPLPSVHVEKTEPVAVVIWVSTPDDPTPLQVTGGYIQ